MTNNISKNQMNDWKAVVVLEQSSIVLSILFYSELQMIRKKVERLMTS